MDREFFMRALVGAGRSAPGRYAAIGDERRLAALGGER
jgi:hypothetical protein